MTMRVGMIFRNQQIFMSIRCVKLTYCCVGTEDFNPSIVVYFLEMAEYRNAYKWFIHKIA